MKDVLKVMQTNLLEYGNTYFNYDLKWDKSGTIPFNFFPIFIDFHYHDLTHDPFLITLEEFDFSFKHDENGSGIKSTVPLVRDWNITFAYEFDFLFSNW